MTTSSDVQGGSDHTSVTPIVPRFPPYSVWVAGPFSSGPLPALTTGVPPDQLPDAEALELEVFTAPLCVTALLH